MAKATAGEAIQALHDSNGLVSKAADMLGISRSHMYTLINKYPTVKQARIDAREKMKDFTESKIYQKISDGDTTMIIFFAKTQMKDRGYVERQEIVGKDSGPIEVDTNPREKLISKLDSIAVNEAAADDIERTD